jgi:hypothetical protein
MSLNCFSIEFATLFHRILIKIETLCEDHFQPLEWQIVNGNKYSIRNKVEALDTQYRIVIEYNARVSNNNPDSRGLGLKVFEQISRYQVNLYEKYRQNWIILQENLTGHGFSGWNHIEINFIFIIMITINTFIAP